MCLTMSQCCCRTPHCSASHSLTHTCILLPFTHTFVHLAHMQTQLTFPPALPTLQILTDGDIEAVNAEGSTPTLPESMLLGVSLHRFGTLRSPLCLLICFNASCQLLCLFFSFVWVTLLLERKRKCSPLTLV